MQYYLETLPGAASDNLDTATSNVLGAAAAVCAACGISFVLDQMRYYYYGRLLQRDADQMHTTAGNFSYNVVATMTAFVNSIGLGRQEDVDMQTLSEKLKKQSSELQDPAHARAEMDLTKDEEKMIVE